MRSSLPAILSAVCVIAACGNTPTGPTDLVATGVWGSDQVRFTVMPTGATIESGCDSGRIETQLIPDRTGRFSAAGTYAFGTGGPTRLGDPPAKAHSARYDGTIDGRTMRLTVSLPELSRTLGPFQLTLGRENLLERCL